MKKKKKHAGGRPTVMTKEVISKLEQAFSLGCTDLEACAYANICHQALYDYQEKYPRFTERKAQLKQKPILLARQTVVTALKEPDSAKWFLERKLKKEFSLRQELTGEDGKDLFPPLDDVQRERLKGLL